MTKKRYERIKAHVKKHEVVYSCVVTGVVVAGITTIIMRSCGAAVPRVADGPVKVTVQPLSFFSKQENAIMTIIHRGGSGAPSYIVECLETGEAWLSQRQAAMMKNVSESVMSGHLNGKLDDVNGFHFRRIGLAAA
jgi:hypothetical protein